MPVLPYLAPDQVPLTPEQLASLHAAGGAYRALRRAAGVASFSGLPTLLIGLASAAWNVFDPGLTGIVVALALCTFGAVELIARQRLLGGKANAVRLLTWNQIAFMAAVVLYCSIQMATFSVKSLQKQVLSQETRDELAMAPDILGQIDQSTRQWGPTLFFSFYGLVILLSVASQGSLAWYYARRRKHLEAFRAASDWEKQLLLKLSP